MTATRTSPIPYDHREDGRGLVQTRYAQMYANGPAERQIRWECRVCDEKSMWRGVLYTTPHEMRAQLSQHLREAHGEVAA